MLARMKLEDEGNSRHGRNTRSWIEYTQMYEMLRHPVPVALKVITKKRAIATITTATMT